jgi:predicted transglutaminase-like cysteine proteinase
VSVEKQWGIADHWSDPFETLLSYRGDCEDYAILKYAALLEAGIPKDDVNANIPTEEVHHAARSACQRPCRKLKAAFLSGHAD